MAISTVVVDDEPLARASITSLLRTDPDIVVAAECGSGRDAIAEIGRLRPALLFLDVQMPECDGFEVIETLGSEAPSTIVFVTAYDRYAVKAFDVEALDYLLKPFSDERFFRVLARAKAAAMSPEARPSGLERLMVKSAGRVVFLKPAEVDWIEAADYYACLHAGGRTHLIRRSMSDLERDLDQNLFCRIHRSAIVNMARVRELKLDSNGEYEAVLEHGTVLKVSRSYREKLRARMAGIARL